MKTVYSNKKLDILASIYNDFKSYIQYKGAGDAYLFNNAILRHKLFFVQMEWLRVPKRLQFQFTLQNPVSTFT